MARLDLDKQDETVVLLALCLLDDLLLRSSYPPEWQTEIKRRLNAIIEKIQTVQEHDAYGNPY